MDIITTNIRFQNYALLDAVLHMNSFCFHVIQHVQRSRRGQSTVLGWIIDCIKMFFADNIPLTFRQGRFFMNFIEKIEWKRVNQNYWHICSISLNTNNKTLTADVNSICMEKFNMAHHLIIIVAVYLWKKKIFGQ